MPGNIAAIVLILIAVGVGLCFTPARLKP